jgi:sugar lactone lactonase YvrE
MHHPNTAAFHGPVAPLRRAAWACALALFGLACGGHKGGSTAAEPTSYPPPIAVQPLDEVLTSGQTATFSVVAAGSGTVTYQWYKSVAGTAAAISGATAPTYTTPAGALTDSGSSFYVVVTSQAGTVTSRSAVLTVVANGTVSTFAGAAGSPGSGDGLGTAAHFLSPFAIATDGNVLFVADTGNHTIRRIDAAGNVSTWAGTAGTPGSTDANGTSASFNQPTGLAIDAGGNLYVADSGNRTIRVISPTKDVTTLAGAAGVYGSADGTGTAASFAFPQGIAVDASGTVYVADAYNNTLRRITAAGVVTTLAGTVGTAGSADGTGTAATFNLPMGLALNATTGTLYVADANNHVIRRVTTAGVVTTVAGTAGSQGLLDGAGTAARFRTPMGVALDAAGNLYIADSDNRCIRKMDAVTAVTTQAGSSLNAGTANGIGAAASFGQPTGVAIFGGNAYIVDATYGTVRKLIPGS